MKKFAKALVLLLILTIVVTCLVACGETPCEHTYSDDLTCHNRACTLCGEVQVATTSHNFDNQLIEDDYIFSTATCTQKARYYYSCDCGEKGTQTFEYGEALGHSWGEYVSDNNATYTADGTKTATCTRTDCGATDTVTDVGTKLPSGISFGSLSVTGTKVNGVVSNDTEVFAFVNEISIIGNADFIVALDLYGIQQVPTKMIPLSIGNNVAYVLEMIDGSLKNVYEVTIRRRPTYTVYFDTNGGTNVDSQTVEEDSLATPPTTTRVGYTFASWDYDFDTPITSDVTITASWNPNTDTAYTVEYYLQNIGDDYYSLAESLTEVQSGTTDTTANVTAKDIDHFTYNEALSTASGNIASDGSLVLKLYYTRDSYTVTFLGDGGTLTSGNATQSVKYGGSAIAPTFSKTGYTFTGFDKDYDNITEPITVTAEWSANTDTAYTVEYYLQNIGDDDYTLTESLTEVKSGTTDTTANVTAKSIEHFTYSDTLSTASGNIAGDGSLVLKLYYTRDSYDITAQVGNVKAGSISSNGGNYRYGTEITLTATTNDGYTFSGWNDGTGIVCEELEYTFTVDGDVELTAEWSANTDTAYTVEYYLQNIGDDDYPLTESLTEVKSGTTDTTANVTAKDIDHFTYNEALSTASGNIAGDGSLVLKLYYTRDSYTIAFDANGGTLLSGNETQEIKYGGVIPVPTFTRDGYDFAGWDKVVPATMPGEDLTITATWNAIFNISGGTINGLTAYSWDFKDIVIPAQIDGVEITEIGRMAFTETGIQSVTIPDSVTKIGDFAFCGCFVLEEVNIGENSKLQSIGEQAFLQNELLTEIYIPNGVTSISDWAFSYCFALTDIQVGAENAKYQSIDGNLYSKDGKTLVQYAIGKTATAFVVPNTVTHIGGGAFESCDSIQKVIIPYNTTDIGAYAFRNCSSLESITFDEENLLESIGDEAFYDCTSLENIIILENVTSIGNSAFAGCTSLTIYCEAESQPDGWNEHWNYTNCPVEWGCSMISTKGLVYNLINNNTEYEVIDYTGTDADVIIPSTYRGKMVTSIDASAFYGCTSLTSITILDSVTSIGSLAFKNCTALNKVNYLGTIDQWVEIDFNGSFANPLYYAKNLYINDVLVEDVVLTTATKISRNVFYNCTSLTSITIPDSVTSIASSAFYNCPIEKATIPAVAASYIKNANLKEVEITSGDSIDSDAFSDCTALESITIPDSVVSIDSSAFSGCTSLESVTFGENSQLESIGNYAFSYCDSLTTITIPDSVTSIGSSAFSGCTSLESVTFGENSQLESIGNNAFDNCTSLESVTFGENSQLESIGYRAFQNCTALTSITIPASVTSIGLVSFSGCTSLTNVLVDKNNANYMSIDGNLYSKDGTTLMQYAIGKTNTSFSIPSTVTSIDAYAFSGCTSLESVTFGENSQLESIGYEAFRGCTSLTSIAIPDSVTSIGSYAFSGCTTLESVNFGENSQLESIGYEAFRGCISLTSIAIPDSVTSIGSYAFSGCTTLESVTFGENSQLESIGNNAFYNCTSLTSITIPDSVTSIDSSAFYNTAYYNDESNWEDVALYIGKHLIDVKDTISGSYTVKADTKSIAASAFYGCSSLTFITISDSVTRIGSSTFYGCASLASITIPNNVTSIGSYAFYNCTSLTSITIPDSVTSIGRDAFSGCTTLKSVTFGENSQLESIGWDAFYNCTSLTSITIPDNVTSIGKWAFSYCKSLTSITIPDSVISIGDSAFYNTAYYNGESNWKDGVLYIGKHLIDVKDTISGSYTVKADTKSIAASAFYRCTSLTSITIPDSVTSIGSYAFENCTSLTIYCEAESQPSGWNSYWNYSNRPVYWYSESEPTTTGNYWRYVDGVVTIW